MNSLLGGCLGWHCGCGCHGPSSTYDNQNANAANGYGSVGGNIICWCWNGGWTEIDTR